MKARRVFLSCVIFFSFALCSSAHSQELYRWVDTDGNVHYTTRFERIPKQYRDQVLKQRTRKNVQKPPVSIKKSEPEKAPPKEKKIEQEEKVPAPVSAKKVEIPVQPKQKPENKSKFMLKSPTFSDKGKIPSKYGRRSGNLSPPLTWENPPEGTKSYVLTLTEPEAPGGPFTHWVIYNISANQANLPEGVPRKISVDGAQQTRNDFNGIGYGGPDSTGEVRKYLFRIVALDVQKIRKPRPETLRDHFLGEATLTAFYP